MAMQKLQPPPSISNGDARNLEAQIMESVRHKRTRQRAAQQRLTRLWP